MDALKPEFNLEFIKARRKEMGMTLQEMAEALGMKNSSNYMKYENGDYAFRAAHLPVLAEKFKCEVENFFDPNFAEIAKKEVG